MKVAQAQKKAGGGRRTEDGKCTRGRKEAASAVTLQTEAEEAEGETSKQALSLRPKWRVCEQTKMRERVEAAACVSQAESKRKF